jgi:hypothetical protein
VEQAPVGSDYSIPHIGEYSFNPSDYLIANPPFSLQIPAINIDFVGSGGFSPIAEATQIGKEFASLARQWKNDTKAVSSLSAMFMHPAYQRIMAMGESAVPFILRELRDRSGHWFYALRYIAGQDIAAGTDTISNARAAWLEWGYKNGYI